MAADILVTRFPPLRGSGLRRFGLAVLLLLTGCSSYDFGAVGRTFEDGVDMLATPFMGRRYVVASDSLTAQRIRGANPAVEPLLPEPGNVWPAEEAPRPTLMGGPDEAMRNIPAYRPSLIEGAPPATSPVPVPGERRGRRGSSTPPQALDAPGEFPRSPAAEPFAPSTTPPRNRSLENATGRIPPPGPARLGNPGPTAGGAVIRDGNVETYIGPDGRSNTRLVPLTP